jgi:alpha-amylase/alpha-mannosidase (GH57 family)
MHAGWSQAWRRDLREAMDWLRDALAPTYEEKGVEYLKDPWKARDDYIEVVLDRTAENVERFFERNKVKEPSREEKSRALKLLEMQRNAMLMFTSCGWFFDEISGIETTQVLQYAARAIQLAEELSGASLEKDYLQILQKAPSNVQEFENGAKIYETFVKPAMIDLPRVGAHYAISSLFGEYPENAQIFCYRAYREVYDREGAGKLRMAIGKTRLASEITWDEEPISFAVLHLGDPNLNGGVKEFMGEEAFSLMQTEIKEAFHKGDIPEVIRLMDKHFGMNNYSLWHLFRDEQRKVLNQLLRSTMDGIEASLRKIYEENYPVMSFLRRLMMPLPKPFSAATEYLINLDLKRVFEDEELNIEKFENLMKEAKRWSVEIDKSTIGFTGTSWINCLMEKFKQQPEEIGLMERLENALTIFTAQNIKLDLWKAQNVYFSIEKKWYAPVREKADQGDDHAKRWIDAFHKLGSRLHVKVTS